MRNKDQHYWIEQLALKPHSEGGFYKEILKSKETWEMSPGVHRPYYTSIYFLLTRGNPSHFHRLQFDEVWYFHDGSPLTIHLLHPDGRYEQIKLGNNPDYGEVLQAVAPKHTIFGSSIEGDGDFSLVSCMVSPGFRTVHQSTTSRLLSGTQRHHRPLGIRDLAGSLVFTLSMLKREKYIRIRADYHTGGNQMARFGFGNIMQGLAGNMSELPKESLEQGYAAYLFEDEEIEFGYKLLRDAIIFTNQRIIFVDRQGATGKKTSFKSIYLSHIVDVEMETAGTGFDDSEITVTYLGNVKRKAHAEQLLARKFEFPKATDILPLYRLLGSLALKNREEINSGE